MSSSKYPWLAARWRALVVGVWLLAQAVQVSASVAVVGISNFQQGPAPGSPGSYYSATPSNKFNAFHISYSFSSSTLNVVRFYFQDLFLYGGQFVNLSELPQFVPASPNPSLPAKPSLTGTLQSISINATVTNTEGLDPNTYEGTWASDLTVLVARKDVGNNPDTNNGGSTVNLLLEVGGTSGFETGTTPPATYVEEAYWYPSFVASEITSVSTTYLVSGVISPGLAAAGDPLIWLGHGFTTSAGANYGSWTGYVDFTFTGSGGSGVADASRTALLLAPGTLLLLGLAGRARRRG